MATIKNTAVIAFNPYIGDTFLAAALARTINEAKFPATESYLLGLPNDYVDYFTDHNIMPMNSEAITAFINEAKSLNEQAPLRKVYVRGNLELYFTPTKPYETAIKVLAQRVLDEVFKYKKMVLFNFHYSYPFTVLAREARERGIPVFGYLLGEGDNVMMVDHRGDYRRAIIWTPEFIGQRLSRLFIGRDLPACNFQLRIHPQRHKHGKVCLFPGTRGNGLPMAKNWELDMNHLIREGYQVKMVLHPHDRVGKDLLDATRSMIKVRFYPDLAQMVERITESEFVVCYDSAAFHIAWYFGVPAVVKLKGGFNYEWVPDWARSDFYQFIDPVMMYEEEYLHRFGTAVDKIRKALRASGGRKYEPRGVYSLR